MIKFDLENLYKVGNEHGLNKDEFESSSSHISSYIDKIHARKVGFYSVIDDNETIQNVKEYARNVSGQYDHIVVLGIGGSALGPICLRKSLGHLFMPGSPSLDVIENIDPDFIAGLEDAIDFSKTLFITISKSGNTTETMSEYFYYKGRLEALGLDYKDHFAFVTGPTGWMRDIAEEEGYPVFDIPADVGGRFSVLTPVGLLPAALIGIDINELLRGAREMRDKFLSEDFETNLPFQLASIQHQLSEKGKTITVMYPYSQRLIYLADWYKQLLAESIGKTEEIGLTPVRAVGVTDQHSQSQLYMDGPKDKLIMFLEVRNFNNDVEIGFHQDGHYLNNMTFNRLIHVEKKGTADALTEKGRPNMTIQVEQVDEYALGQLFMLFQGSIAFLGELYNINAFDQPGVELSKELTKQYLNESA